MEGLVTQVAKHDAALQVVKCDSRIQGLKELGGVSLGLMGLVGSRLESGELSGSMVFRREVGDSRLRRGEHCASRPRMRKLDCSRLQKKLPGFGCSRL